MSFLNQLSVDFTVLKEPRGLLRFIQFIVSIFAFATLCTSAEVALKVTINCNNNGTKYDKTATIPIKYSYPFKTEDIDFTAPTCDGSGKTFSLSGNFSSSAQFFCFVGVMAFLYCLAILIGYIVFSSVFSNNSRAALVDFIITCVWTLMWFISSCAWADNVNKMGSFLDPEYIKKEDMKGYCDQKTVNCQQLEGVDHATLIVSVLFGFLNFIIWGASLWFLFKETHWHKEQAQDTQQFDQPQATDPSPSTGGEGSYQAPTY